MRSIKRLNEESSFTIFVFILMAVTVTKDTVAVFFFIIKFLIRIKVLRWD